MLILPLTFLLFTESASAGTLPLGDIRIKGTGRVSKDRTLMDIHFELINNKNNVSQALSSQPITNTSASPVSLKGKDQTAVKQAAITSRPVFGDETGKEFVKSALDFHNQFRMIHNAPPVRLNANMSKEAEQFAKKLALNGAKNLPMKHEDQLVLKKENEGENIAAGGSIAGGLTAYGAVKNWYNEVCLYDWGKGGYEPLASHFLQVISKNTKELGIGKANGIKNGKPYTYIVARYKPGIDYDALKNVAKGKFNQIYCRNILAFSRSKLGQDNTNSPKQKVQGRNFSYFPKRPANVRPLLDGSQKQIPPDPIHNNLKSLSPLQPAEQQSNQAHSDQVQNRTSYLFQQNLANRVSKQYSNYYTNNLANLPPVRSVSQLQTSSFNLNEQRGNYGSISQNNNRKYRNGYLNILEGRNPYERSRQDDKLSYFAGNAWGTASNDRIRQPVASSSFAKQAGVLGKFAKVSSPYKWGYGGDSERFHLNEMVSQRLLPVTSSEYTEMNDVSEGDPSDYDTTRRKNYVPVRSRWNIVSG